MKKKNKIHTILSRVDVQVCLLAVCMVVISSTCIFAITYRFTYKDMMWSLTERVHSIYSYLEQELLAETFEEVNTKEDMQKNSYRDMKNLFFTIKQATGVQYLYTAKRTEDGRLVYVIDGLDHTAADFRYPGDPIEEEIVVSLERALNNEAVMPQDIKHTTWGDIFIAYLPIHNDEGSVIGAIGIEFEAAHQYITYLRLRHLTPLVILIVCIISGLTALLLFKRLSNPLYQDLANTDWLTSLKNRNAYEVDTRNLAAKGAAKGTALLLADLNGLKKINDTLGHDAGDKYLCAMASALRMAQSGSEVLYRVGGDEFVVLIPQSGQHDAEEFAARLEKSFRTQNKPLLQDTSFAIGWALCTENSPSAFDAAYGAADSAMYECKKRYYASL